MKSLVVVALLLVCCGCSTDSISLPTFRIHAKPPVDHIAELKVFAGKRHMWWRIYCTDWERMPSHQFQADLCQTTCDKLYDEDGGKPRWIGSGATQQDAAADLIADVEEYPIPNHEFGHPKEVKHKQCPPELEGGPQ